MFEKLLILGSIRNSFAHINQIEDYTELFTESSDKQYSERSKVLQIMNAKGIIKSKNVSELHKDFKGTI